MAALQVAIHHIINFFGVGHADSLAFKISSYFPGVPIFFFVSGFLISKSFENSRSVKKYARNRILRIYPALIVCTLFSLLTVFLSGYLKNQDINVFEFLFWVFGQISFIQFYNPEFMRGFGTGVLNGSLWTICVELQFYIIIPLLYKLFRISSARNSNKNLLILIFIFFSIYVIKSYYIPSSENPFFKLIGVSFVPWVWMFLVGAFFQRNFDILFRLLSNKALYILPFYLLVAYYSTRYFGLSLGNKINPVLFVLLTVFIFSFAYSTPSFSKKTLKGNDISYGVYIYHIPIVNLFMFFGYVTETQYVFSALFFTILFAGLSWFLIERNVLKLKKDAMNPIYSKNTATMIGKHRRMSLPLQLFLWRWKWPSLASPFLCISVVKQAKIGPLYRQDASPIRKLNHELIFK